MVITLTTELKSTNIRTKDWVDLLDEDNDVHLRVRTHGSELRNWFKRNHVHDSEVSSKEEYVESEIPDTGIKEDSKYANLVYDVADTSPVTESHIEEAIEYVNDNYDRDYVYVGEKESF